MDNSVSALNKIKQPEPSIKDNGQKRKFNFPHVGVINVPKISNFPVMDEYIKQANANPQIKYVSAHKSNNIFDIQNIISISIVTLGVASILKLLKACFKK